MRRLAAHPLSFLGSLGTLASLALLGLLQTTAPGCSSKASVTAAPPSPDAGSGFQYPALDPTCDPIVPSHCGFPMPSNFWTKADTSSKTGLRIDFKTAMLPVHNKKPTDPAPFNKLDGFSTGMNLTVHLPGATATGLPSHTDLGASIKPTAKTVVLDAETGELVPHWSELDSTAKAANDEVGDQTTFFVRPAIRLKDSHRYIVAIRHVVDAEGAELPASPAFMALRDGGSFAHPSIAARRALYADIFAKLKNAGVEQSTLQLAWDFTTSSRDNNTAWMLKMRDEALATVGADGPTYTVKDEQTDPNPDTHKRYMLTMHVPSYLDKPEPGGKLVFGADGMPKQNGFADFDVIVQVPNSAFAAGAQPAALVQNGHGLLGLKTEGDGGYLTMIGNKQNYVTFSVDFVGMSHDDNSNLTDTMIGDIGGFGDIVGRQHQGLLNSLLAMRMMKGRWAKDQQAALGRPLVDPTLTFYRGDSQGGIFGGAYLALSTDVKRGLLSVPGGPYSILLNRSQDFGPFFFLLGTVYDTSLDVQLAIDFVQMFWDKTEPNGYLPYMTENPLPGTPSHNVLFQCALGDHQVNTLGAHYEARTTKAALVDPAVRDVWGLEKKKAPFAGNAIVEFDFGNPPDPITNEPPTQGQDPHEFVRRQPEAYQQADAFFRTGQITQVCTGPCVFK
jgi:hypothetical protein